MTFEQYLTEQHTRQTTKTYMSVINHFLFHSSTKDDSSYSDIIDYLATFQFTSSNVLAGLKKYFNYLIETGQRDDHPCKSLYSREPIRAIQFQDLFTPEELEKVMHRPERYPILATRNQVILSLLIHQGLSPANLVNLELKDLNMEEGTIYIKSTKIVKRRTLELKPKQILLFYTYIQKTRPKLLKTKTEQLLIGKLGNPISTDTINRMLLPMKTMFPTRKFNAKAIRKSVIANWLNIDQIPLEDVQLLSGQKWISTTERYIRPNSEENRGMINEFFPI